MKLGIQKTNNRWEVSFPFDWKTKDFVKSFGLTFDWDKKVWHTTDEGKIQQMKAALNGEMPEVPFPEGITPYQYQREGIAFSLGRKHVLIADEPGVGKTWQAIGVCNYLQPQNVLIICPASLRLNWKIEWGRVSTQNVEISIPNSTKSRDLKGIVILNYEKVSKMKGEIDKVAWDVLICDESHRLKNRKAAVTKAVFGKWHKDPQKRIEPIKAGKILLLTGTPILNRPEELWTTCHAIDPFGVGKSWWDFVHKYCAAKKTRFGIDTSGASNLQELKERISPFTIRRLKKDVLKELPEKREQVIVLQPDPEQAQAVKAEREAVEMSELNLDNPNLNIMLNQIAILRQQTALTKLSSCYDIFSDDLQSSKLVIMAHHRAVCEAIHQNYPNSVMVYGGMSERDKQKAIERFQNDKNCNVFVGSISAAGVGITLTAASQLSFVEFDWTPGKMAQAADRIHRVGQKEGVLIKYIVLDGSIDAYMINQLLSKKNTIAKIISH